jgi:hypothetical protein
MISPKRLTAAELDPVSKVTARMFVIAVGVVSLALSIALTLTPSELEQMSIPVLGVTAQIVLVVSYIFLVRAAEPFEGSVSRGRFQIFLAGIMLASVLNSLSQFGTNELIRDDWGAVCLGVALLLAAPYRRPTEIVWFTVQAVVLTFTLAVVQNLSSATAAVLSLLALIAATPAIAIGVGAAAYAHSLISSFEGVKKQARTDRSLHEAQLRARLAETDAMGELGSLRSDVVPFLSRLNETGRMRDDDAARAAELASVLRRAIVDRLARGTLADAVGNYSDGARIAAHLDERQRAALRALIAAVTAAGVDVEKMSLSLYRHGMAGRGTLTFPVPPEGFRPGGLMPFFRMIRLVFDDVAVRTVDGRREVAFTVDSGRDSAAVSWEL